MTPLAPMRVEEAADSLAKASSPEPFSKSRTSNWIARSGGLPPYIQHIAHDLMEKRGKSESNAIQMAIGIVRNWARGQGKVDANTRAAAAKAVAEFEAKRAGTKAKSAAKVSESRRRASSISVADRVTLRTAAKARLRAIAEAFDAQQMLALVEANDTSWSPEVKRTASASSEIERFEVHDAGQHVGYLAARKGYGPGSARPTRWNAKATNGRMVSDTEDSKQAALDGLRKHLEEGPARVAQHPSGKWLVAEPESYSGATRHTEYPSESSARFAAGLPEQPSTPERKSKVAALGEMLRFDIATLELIGEALPTELPRNLVEAMNDGPDKEPDGDPDDAPFSKGDRVNWQHARAGRVRGRVTKITSRHVHLSSADPRVPATRMTHKEAKDKLSLTSKGKMQESSTLGSLLESRIEEAALTAKRRNALPKDDFVYPEKAPGSGSYPIDTRKRAIAALARAADPANAGDEATVKAKVYAKYPDLKPAKGG